MDHFAGLDVSVKETSVCIVNDAGKIVKEVKVASEPQALLKVAAMQPFALRTCRSTARYWPMSVSWPFASVLELRSRSEESGYRLTGKAGPLGRE
jgi:transposase